MITRSVPMFASRRVGWHVQVRRLGLPETSGAGMFLLQTVAWSGTGGREPTFEPVVIHEADPAGTMRS